MNATKEQTTQAVTTAATQVTQAVAESVERVRRHIEAAVANATPRDDLTLPRLAVVAKLSQHHLQRQFKRVVGLSPAEYVRMRRTELLRGELRSETTVSRAVFGAGYGSGSRVYDAAAGSGLGMTPAAYKLGGADMDIRFSVVASAFGRLLVAVTERGVCAVTLGEDDAVLERALHTEYPRARSIERVDDGADEWLATLVQRVSSQLPGGDADSSIPLDVRGTTFQWRVWRALQQIPSGETRSYTDIANEIGRPTAVRAVARACASNRVALVVPCHRVVRGDGSLGGYRWGIERKGELLTGELRVSTY